MIKPRKFVIGDIHSHFEELMEIFEKVDFQFDKDLLISLGDVVDRGSKPLEVIEKLKQIKNFIHILGNHDEWCYQYLKFNIISNDWTSQGGMVTLNAYKAAPDLREDHIEFFEKARLFYIDSRSNLFVHGGFNPRIPFNLQKEDRELLISDRSLVMAAVEYDKTNKIFNEFSEIFIGHTPTQFVRGSIPVKISNIWMLDTGVYHSGILTIMNIETKEFWQSSPNSIHLNKFYKK
jgi:serine/threonine protein phosphatase 1